VLANFRAPSPEPHFPGIFSVASEPKGAACEVHLLQEEEFPEAEADVPDEPPDLAENVLHPRHRRRRWLPARIMLVSKESGHHGMNAFDHRTPSIPEDISEHPPVMVFGDASQPRSFGERRHKKRFRRLQRHAAAHPPRASNGLMVILDRPSMPPTFPVRPTNENDHSALDPPVKNRLSYFRGNNVPRHNGSDEQKE